MPQHPQGRLPVKIAAGGTDTTGSPGGRTASAEDQMNRAELTVRLEEPTGIHGEHVLHPVCHHTPANRLLDSTPNPPERRAARGREIPVRWMEAVRVQCEVTYAAILVCHEISISQWAARRHSLISRGGRHDAGPLPELMKLIQCGPGHIYALVPSAGPVAH
jgi:hypothetical protein